MISKWLLTFILIHCGFRGNLPSAFPASSPLALKVAPSSWLTCRGKSRSRLVLRSRSRISEYVMFVRCPRSLSFQLRAISKRRRPEISLHVRKYQIYRASNITRGIFPRDNEKRFQTEKKGIVIYLRDRIGEWVDSDIIEAPFNPIRIYEFNGISLWMQLIASGIKSSFMSRITDSRGHERCKEDRRISEASLLCFSLWRNCDITLTAFCPFHSLSNCYALR